MSANGPVASGDLFFFYGLLKKDASGMPAHIDLEAGGEFLRPVTLRGSLYNLGGYPGIFDGEGLVQGILYRLDDVSLIGPLDEFEDVVPGDQSASLYQRIQKPVLDEIGAPTGETAWVYWFNQPFGGYEQLVDGNWPLEGARNG